jgi:dCMP deaminase
VPRERLPDLMLAFAEEVSRLSTCSRLSVGAVVTDVTLEQVLGYGYNGNAVGLPNRCDSDLPGACRCVHAEANALLKAAWRGPKHLFVTATPCVMCAKLMVNAGVVTVHAATWYRDRTGVTEVLGPAGVTVVIRDEAGVFRKHA